MPKYTVNHSYRAFHDGRQYGPYEASTVVELDASDAEWVNRDSPGCLSVAEEKVEQPPVQPNRAHKGGRNRAGG